MRYPFNTVPINGGQVLYGSGTAAIALTASGFNSRQKYGISTAALSDVEASGALKQARAGSGTALINIDSAGAMKQALPAYGEAVVIEIGASYGIPNPKYIPPGVPIGHSSREIRIPADGRIIDVSTEGEF